MNATLGRDAPIAVRNVYEIPRDRSSWPAHFASGLRGPCLWSLFGAARLTPPMGTAASVNVQAPATVPGRQT
jgi:hypothetical protein